MTKKGINVRMARLVISSSPTMTAIIKPAPALIPKIPESARGFLVRFATRLLTWQEKPHQAYKLGYEEA